MFNIKKIKKEMQKAKERKKERLKKIDDPKNPFYGEEKVKIYTNMKNKNPSEVHKKLIEFYRKHNIKIGI
tara:strand:+ start:269 stop:478 length:210 start_codon:yes stop_codon:yes gene_type:complete